MNFSAKAAIAMARAAAPTAQFDVPDLPTVDDLCNWTQENRSLDIHAAVSLGFPIGDVDGSVERNVLLFGTSRWVDVETAQNVFRYGIALRVVVTVSSLDVKGAITLPVIAAHVETSDARASAELIIRGYKGPLGDDLPKWQSFGVEQYADYMNSVSKLQATVLNAPAEALTPQLLATTAVADSLPSTEETAAIVHAILAISHGETLGHALAGKTGSAVDQITEVYQEAGIDGDGTAPDDTQSSTARAHLHSMGVDGSLHRRLQLPWRRERPEPD